MDIYHANSADAAISAHNDSKHNAVVIEPRDERYHAAVRGKAQYWGMGKTRAEALGNLIITFPGVFNVERR